MNSGLKKLVKNLSDNDFKYLTEEFGSKNLELLKEKDAYPYEHMESFKRFSVEELPDKKCFHSPVKDETTDHNGKKSDGHISNEDYLTCNKKSNKQNVGDYHNHYLKKDVLLLADVFEKFIDTCLKFYKLDPCHYFSSPELSWDAMLKNNWCEVRKDFSINIYQFIEKGLRGGISYIAKRHAKANNIYTHINICIPYLDMNNLYGCGMSDYLPYGVFK